MRRLGNEPNLFMKGLPHFFMKRVCMVLVILFLAGCLSQVPESTEPIPAESTEASPSPDVESTPHNCRNSPFGFHTARMIPSRVAGKPKSAEGPINFYEDAQYIGVTWERPALYCHWIIIQPTTKDIKNGVYHWEMNDDIYRAIPEPMCILGNIGLPERVLPHSWELTESEPDYITFVKAVVERYDGDGVDDMPGLLTPVLYWQVENEPDFIGDWKGYARIQKVTYNAVKEACPDCTVLMGGMSGGGIPTFETFYKPILTQLNGECIDIFDFHWYGNAYGDYRGAKSVYETVRKTLDETGFTKTDIWITETGTYSGTPFRWEEQSETDQARDVVKRYVYPLSFGVKKVFWAWALIEGFKHNNGFFDHTAFVYDGEYQDDLGRGKKKLSYYTFKKMTEILEGCDWDSVETLEESDVCVFKALKDGKAIYIMWWDYFHLSYPISERKVVLPVESHNQFRLTEAVPHYSQGSDVNDYEPAFTTYMLQPQNGTLTIVLGKTPVFLEEVGKNQYLDDWINLVALIYWGFS